MKTLTVEQAAEQYFKVHENTVYRMIETCELPAAKFGRSYVMLEEDVVDLIRNQIRLQTSERLKTISPQR